MAKKLENFGYIINLLFEIFNKLLCRRKIRLGKRKENGK